MLPTGNIEEGKEEKIPAVSPGDGSSGSPSLTPSFLVPVSLSFQLPISSKPPVSFQLLINLEASSPTLPCQKLHAGSHFNDL